MANSDKIQEIYENIVKEEKEQLVEGNQTMFDQLVQRIVILEEQVKELTGK